MLGKFTITLIGAMLLGTIIGLTLAGVFSTRIVCLIGMLSGAAWAILVGEVMKERKPKDETIRKDSGDR